ncbi:MAG: putative glycoside hydrolase [bacterium]|nr:putative glycoside hydrolase [bacterium]
MNRLRTARRTGLAIAVLFCGALVFGIWIFLSKRGNVVYDIAAATAATALPAPWRATHIATPQPLKALYMTSYVAGHSARREALISLLDTSELNAAVIDIKDYSGTIAFSVENPILTAVDASENRIPDIREFIERLHEKGVYVIGRISVFQDPKLAAYRPDWAVLRASDSVVWRDRKGLAWIDVGAREAWDYTVALAKESYALGFDELNFDYVRFPSDGDMNDIAYPWSSGRVKSEVLGEFFSFLAQELKPTGAVISADLFGMTTTNKDDLNIGQVLEVALKHFDYVAPMVYPSHYPTGFLGIQNPAAEPYRVIRYSLDRAWDRASTTPEKIRPWLQDFDLGADYTADMVRAQIQATYDAGFTSWMLWNPSNRYTQDALLTE